MMGLLGVKLRRDLRASWPPFVLMVIALAVSLTVVGGVLFAWSAISREAGSAYLSTEPASATIELDNGVTPDKMAEIAAAAKGRPGVLDAVGRTQFDSSVTVDGRQLSVPLQTFVAAPDDEMAMAKFDLERDGAWPPAPREIWLGEDGSLDLLGVAVGDTLTIEAPTGERLDLRIAGTVYDPSLSPSPQEQRGRGYLSTASLAAAGAPDRLDQLKLQISDGATTPSADRTRNVAVAGDVAEWVQREYGLRVAEIQVPPPNRHPHQWQADALLAALLGGGAAALLLSTVLVATMLGNLFTRQIPQIGILKTIGTSTNRIARVYLVMTLLVAAAATALAIVPAILIGQDRVAGLLGMLGVQPTSTAASWWAYLLVVTLGLLLPPLMALFPLIKTSRTSVRAAIDHHGGATTPGLLTRWLVRLSRSDRLNRGLLIGLRNTVRRPARFWLSVGLLVCAGTTFVAGLSLRTATEALDEERLAKRYWDVEVELASGATPDTVAKADLEQVPGVTAVETFQREQIGVAQLGRLPITNTYPDQGHGSVSVNTVPDNSTQPAPDPIEGRWLTAGETGGIVLEKAVRDKYVPGLGTGTKLRVFIDGKPTTWRLVGIVEEGNSAGGGAYATAEGLARATGQPQQVNQLRLITNRGDEATRARVAETVDNVLNAAGADVTLAASENRGAQASSGHLGPILAILIVVAFPLGVIGSIGLASTTGANILDRYREFGIMHAIGARPKTVRRTVIVEGIVIALTSCVLAIVPTVGLTAVLATWLANAFGMLALPLRISGLAVAIWIGVVVLVAVLATDTAATRASRITVREALTYL